MNDSSIDKLLDDWLELGPTSAPERVGAAARLEARSVPQSMRRSWTLMWYDVAAVAMVGVVLAIVLLTQAAPRDRGPGAPGQTSPSPATPTPRPAASVEGLPAACGTAGPSPEVHPHNADYSVGRHWVTLSGVALSFCAPSGGWEPYADFHLSKSESGPQGAEAIVYVAPLPIDELGDGDGFARLCGRLPLWPLGKGAADVASDIAAIAGIEVTNPASQASIGGRPAWQVSFIVREDVGCDPGFLHAWLPKPGGAMWDATESGDIIHAWVVELRGGRLVLIAGELHATASEHLELQVLQIVGSVRFE